MAGFRGQLFKLVFGNQVSLGSRKAFLFLVHFKHTNSLKLYRCYISNYNKFDSSCSTLFFSYPRTSVLSKNALEDWSRREMPPKAKRSASTKASEEGKRKKSSRKNDAGSSDENGAEEVKTPSRQSQRNINKVVTYKDEDFSEDELPKKRGGKVNKRAKSEEDSDMSGSDEVATKSKRVSKKKKHKSEEVDDMSDNDSNDSKTKGGKKKSKSQDNEDGSGDEDGEGGEDDDDDDEDDNDDKSNDDDEEEEKTEEKSAKRKAKSQDSDNEADSESEGSTDEPKSKKSKIDQAATVKKPKGDKTLLNKTQSDFEALDFSSDKTTPDGKPWNLKISSWNVGGLKAWVKKNGNDYIKYEDPDILCLQETKCSENKLPPEMKINGYNAYWLSGEKEGYAGVALLSKEKPINVTYGLGKSEFDNEGRVITAEYEKFYLVAAYVPNAGRGLVTLPKRMKWDPVLRNYIKDLDSKKPVILCGDMNVSHQAIDLANPKTNTKSAGFTQEERDGMTALLGEGFVDSFRHLYPEETGAYTFWTYMGNARSRNTGWRLDYFILSEKLTSNLCDNIIRSEVYGSDHCPITLLLNI